MTRTRVKKRKDDRCKKEVVSNELETPELLEKPTWNYSEEGLCPVESAFREKSGFQTAAAFKLFYAVKHTHKKTIFLLLAFFDRSLL